MWSIVLISFLIFNLSDASDANNPFTFNGGSAMAMAGRNCVALAVDKRFASGPQMVHVSPRRVLKIHSKCVVALVGLDGDVQSLASELSTQVIQKVNRESSLGLFSNQGSQSITPKAMAFLTSHILYGYRTTPLYCEPLIVGLYDNSDPFICSTDMLGAKMIVEKDDDMYACVGAASKSLHGTAEALWKPNMDSDELVQVCGNAFLSALERDCLSGYGAVIYLITPNGIQEYELESRTD